jgi:hypothetical protein
MKLITLSHALYNNGVIMILKRFGLVKLQMKRCVVLCRSNQTARFNESRGKEALTNFYVGFQTIISRLDQNGIFLLGYR